MSPAHPPELVQSTGARAFYRYALMTSLLALVVIGAGAWVRLTDAGLGCPDWPGCYGRMLVPSDADAANLAFPERPLETGKAWREMLHRYLAGALGLAIAGLAALAFARRREPRQPVVLPFLLLVLVVFQAMLGAWTVTLKLAPIVVVAHLLGGMTTLALLAWLSLATRPAPAPAPPGAGGTGLRRFTIVGLVVLTVQLALGGWVSGNYAALACPEFPSCRGAWWPEADFATAFVPWQSGVADFEGGVLDGAARTAIHLTHRLGALVSALVLGALGVTAILRGAGAQRRAGGLVLAALAVQIGLGISVVVLGVPLAVAVAHNLGAALLVIAMVALVYHTYRGTWQTV